MITHKYRAWNIKKKKMIYDPFVYDTNETLAEWSMVRLNEGLKDKRFVFLEYTGLKDRNNVEIYEGDILEFDREPHKVWYNDASFYANRHSDRQNFLLKTMYRLSKVIGNIYENPKLLVGR